LGKVIIVIIIEIGYILPRNQILNIYSNLIKSELWITVLRILSILICYVIFRKTINNVSNKNALDKNILIPTALWLSIPFFVKGNDLGGLMTKMVFFVTSISVGVKEELIYRGILQNILKRKYGFYISIIFSNILFTAMHMGYQNMTVTNILNIFLSGVFLGVVYNKTSNLIFCIAIHSVFDMLYCFKPELGTSMPQIFGVAITLCSIFFLIFKVKNKKYRNIG